MTALGRKARVHVRGDDAVHPELLGNLAQLGDVVAALGELERRHEREERALRLLELAGHARHAGLLGEHEVDLRAGPVHLDARDRAAEVLGQLPLFDEAEERALRVGVRDDDLCEDLGSVLERDAGRAAVAHQDPADGGAGADVGAELPRGRGHGLRDRAHAAHDVAVEALQVVLAPREEMEEQAERGPRRVRAAVLAVDVVGEEERLDLLGLVVAVEEVAEAPGQERHHARDLVSRDPAEALAHAQRLHHARDPARVDVRRRLEEEWLEVAREELQLVVHAHERPRVGRRELRELAHRALAVRPPGRHGAVGEGHEQRRIARDHLQTVTGQVEVPDDLGAQHARDVGRRRGAAARRDLLGHAGAADDRAPLDDERGEPGAGEIGCGRQAIVPPAHDDGIVGSALRLIASHDVLSTFFKLAQVDFNVLRFVV